MHSFHSQRYCNEGSAGWGLGDETGWQSVDLLFMGLPRGFVASMLLVRFFKPGVVLAVVGTTVAGDVVGDVVTTGVEVTEFTIEEAGTGVMVTWLSATLELRDVFSVGRAGKATAPPEKVTTPSIEDVVTILETVLATVMGWADDERIVVDTGR